MSVSLARRVRTSQLSNNAGLHRQPLARLDHRHQPVPAETWRGCVRQSSRYMHCMGLESSYILEVYLERRGSGACTCLRMWCVLLGG